VYESPRRAKGRALGRYGRRVRFSTDDLAAATGGVVLGPTAEVDGISIDSRTVAPGQLFVPIVAERDGHDFIHQAVAAGAAAYLTARDGEPIAGASAIGVADTAAALLDLGRAARARLPARVVGVTGSVGKTSTKDLLAAALATTYATTANERSFNNELGLPITLCGAPAGTEAVVVEMGARGVGHISLLCDIARPTVGIVTRVDGVHLELFGDLRTVALAKGELVEALPADGLAVLNADQPAVAAMAARTAAEVVRFGRDPGADVTAEDVSLDAELRPRFTLRTPWGSTALRLAARGEHQIANALAAAAAAIPLGVPVDAVADAFATAAISALRMQLERTPSGALVLNDAYNANPTSMAAALDALVALPASRRIAVLGIMAELGDDAEAAHRAVALRAGALGIRVIAVAAPWYGPDAEHVADVEGALGALGVLGESDAVVVKGSRVAGMERVAAALVNPGPAPQG
jgi:UDP-N-acetylmuramoyl-tripeptide--D-alanyl-D-alanine ligase